MNFILWLIFGALAGWIASKIMKTDAEQGAFLNIIVGIIGAYIGGFLSGLIGGPGVSGFNLTSLLVAIVGASVLLWIVNMMRGRHRA